jgi:hypothetical protein
MRSHTRKSISLPVLGIATLAGLSLTALPATAQNPEVQQRLADVKEASAKNKQEVATCTWQEQDTIGLKSEVKKQDSYQVQMGADGKPVKTPLNAASAQQQQPPAEAQGRPQTITFDKTAKAIQSLRIGSYLDSPSDAVKIGVQFATLPDGVNHIANMTLEGVSKQLEVVVEDSAYKKM